MTRKVDLLVPGATVVVTSDPESRIVVVTRVAWDASRLNLKVFVDYAGTEYELFADEVSPVRREPDGTLIWL